MKKTEVTTEESLYWYRKQNFVTHCENISPFITLINILVSELKENQNKTLNTSALIILIGGMF